MCCTDAFAVAVAVAVADVVGVGAQKALRRRTAQYQSLGLT